MAAVTAQMPDMPETSFIRDRATTMSSNASTAVPPRLDANLGSMSDFGTDFSMNMFEGLSSPRQATANVAAPQATHSNFGRSVRRQQSPGFTNSTAIANGYQNQQQKPQQQKPQQQYQQQQQQLPQQQQQLLQQQQQQQPQQQQRQQQQRQQQQQQQQEKQQQQQQRPRQVQEPVFAAPIRQNFTPSPELEPEAPRRPTTLTSAATNRYSWASRTSDDGLMSPALSSDISSPSMKPPSSFARFRPGYQPVPDRYGSPAHDAEQDGTDSYSSEEDTSQPISSARSPLVESYTASVTSQRNAPATRNTTIATVSQDDLSSSDSVGASSHTTPRANNVRPVNKTNDSLFGSSPAGPASRATHPTAPPVASRSQSQQGSPNKRMTRQEFEAQRRQVSPDESEESEQSEGEGYDDDEEEAERQAELARQRRKQDANMSVYRQQMKKVSGGNFGTLSPPNGRPSLDRASHSAPGLARDLFSVSLGAEQEEEDDEVPLGILQAHGFPSRNKPPTRLASAPPTPGSVAGSVVGGMGGNLPVFARNLPADPYFGAGLVNPANRESLAFGSGGSVYGGASPSMMQLPGMPQPPPQQMPGMPQPGGGLVAVIAGEERARAARRANPNGGTPFNANGMPLPGNMYGSLPRTNSMMSMGAPQMSMGGFMPPQMMGAETQNQQQIMQLMYQQTQMMQQMMAMQNGQPMPQMSLPQMQNGMQRPTSLGSPNGQRPSMHGPQSSMHSQQRSSTMTNLKPPGYAGSMYDYSLSTPNRGYSPSIAPSERSNVGMPSRYRPVTMEGSGSRSGSLTSQSGIQNFANKNASQGSFLNPNNIPITNGSNVPRTTIKIIDKLKGSSRSPLPRADEEDEDEGWAELRKKREERKKRGTMVGNKSQEQTLEELYQGFN
jgi:hypothetical protein